MLASKSVISPYVDFGDKRRSPAEVNDEVPSENPAEKLFPVSVDQIVPLSGASTHCGAMLYSAPVIVEFDGIMNPSYVEFDGLNPTSSGVDSGPCQCETSAEAQGISIISITRK